MFDYIVVGAGSAGCVLANRLSENPFSTVLLLEAGGPDTKPEIHTPAAHFQLWQTEVDWAYWTEEQPQLHNRKIFWPRGKVLGGSSSLNSMMYVRGSPYDYNHWAALGNEGWSYAEVLPYFKKSENQERGATEYHGVDGPLNVADLLNPHPITLALVDAAKEVGIALNDDFNGAQQEGVGLGQVNQRNGKRCSTAVAFLKPAMQRANLTVETHAHVTRLNIEDQRAVGLWYVQNGKKHEIRARREIILCGGSINSPQILMLSGIGRVSHLQEYGIPVLMDLPGVGQNLQDHLLISLHYRCLHRIPIAETSNLAEGDCFIKTRPELPAPDLQIIFGVFSYTDDSGQTTDDRQYNVVPVVLRPESQGTLSLVSNDPLVPLSIEPGYLASDTDTQVLVDGFKIARKIGRANALAAFRDREIQPGSWLQTDDAIRAFIRETASTVFHPVGTCKMGNDAMAVVNDRLQVHGIQGLRVVDASIMPTLTSGNTNAPVIMIAEKAADLIKGNWTI